jgi:lipopolysaccharide/colanic/teichoic acid biosynthesis glycosyltransferase
MSVSQSPSFDVETRSQPNASPEPFSSERRRGFYARVGKRAFDFFVSVLALLVLAPALLAIAVLVKLTSPGPAFYRQNRVGRHARIFQILKFRSMIVDADGRGCGITVGGDERVTGFGRILRETKLDELPQLWNILKGDMSLVGPRPEVPSYVALYTREQLGVLAVAPGITDIASIQYRHEEKLLEGNPDPDDFYRRVILPHKLSLNLQYIQHMSFALDMKLIAQTLRSIF